MPESHNAMEILYEETCLSAVLSCAYPVHAGFAAIELKVTISQKKKKIDRASHLRPGPGF